MGKSLGVLVECGIHESLASLLARLSVAKMDVGWRHHGERGMMVVVVVPVSYTHLTLPTT